MVNKPRKAKAVSESAVCSKCIHKEKTMYDEPCTICIKGDSQFEESPPPPPPTRVTKLPEPLDGYLIADLEMLTRIRNSLDSYVENYMHANPNGIADVAIKEDIRVLTNAIGDDFYKCKLRCKLLNVLSFASDHVSTGSSVDRDISDLYSWLEGGGLDEVIADV